MVSNKPTAVRERQKKIVGEDDSGADAGTVRGMGVKSKELHLALHREEFDSCNLEVESGNTVVKASKSNDLQLAGEVPTSSRAGNAMRCAMRRCDACDYFGGFRCAMCDANAMALVAFSHRICIASHPLIFL